MQFSLLTADAAIRSGQFPSVGTPAGTLAVPAVDLRVHGALSVTVAGAAPRTGQETVFSRPVLTAPAFVKRDRTVLADAWLPEVVRLGALEARLGDGVIEKIVAKGLRNGRLPLRERRRLLSYPMVIRLVIAMTLLPGSSYAEAARVLAGLLADVPFTLDWHVPTGKSIGEWRPLIPAEIMQEVFWHAAGALIGDDEPSAVMVAGMPADAADGMLVNLADTKENRAYFGTTGTGDGSSPFPQLRIVALTARAGRAIRGAVLGTARDGEQTLLKTLVSEQPGLFAGRVTLFDRNFPGHDVILAILLAGGQVIARARGGIALPFPDTAGKGWLDDGSRASWLNAPFGEERGPAPGPGRRALGPGRRPGRGAGIGDLHPDHNAPGRGRGAGRGPAGRLPEPADRVGDHLRREQGHHHRRREPHLRPGAPLRLPAARRAGSLGVAHLGPARPRGRGRHLAQRGGRRTRPAPQGRQAGHRRRGILHRRLAPRRPLPGDHPGHGHLLHSGPRSRRGLGRPRAPAHPQPPRAGPALPARAESTPEIPAHVRDQADRHREIPGHRVRARPLLNPSPRPCGREEEKRPAARGTARPTRRDTRAIPMPARNSQTDTKEHTEHEKRKAPPGPKHLKVMVLTIGRLADR